MGFGNVLGNFTAKCLSNLVGKLGGTLIVAVQCSEKMLLGNSSSTCLGNLKGKPRDIAEHIVEEFIKTSPQQNNIINTPDAVSNVLCEFARPTHIALNVAPHPWGVAPHPWGTRTSGMNVRRPCMELDAEVR